MSTATKTTVKEMQAGLVSLNLKQDQAIEKKNNSKECPMKIKKIDKTRVCKTTQAGVALEIKNYKALRIIIQNVVVNESHFSKLFPLTKYEKFNIKITFDNGGKKFYIYFPKEMISDIENIRVVYRQKLNEFTYKLVVSDTEEDNE